MTSLRHPRHDPAVRRDHGPTIRFLTGEQRNRYFNGLYVEIPPPGGACDQHLARAHKWKESGGSRQWIRALQVKGTNIGEVFPLSWRVDVVRRKQGFLCYGFFATAEYLDDRILLDLKDAMATVQDTPEPGNVLPEDSILRNITARAENREAAVSLTAKALERFFDVDIVGDYSIIQLTNPKEQPPQRRSQRQGRQAP